MFYPGSYVDLAPSFVFGSVTYLDADKRAPRFFADTDGVLELIAQHHGPPEPDITFIHGDYATTLDLPEGGGPRLRHIFVAFRSTGTACDLGRLSIGTNCLVFRA